MPKVQSKLYRALWFGYATPYGWTYPWPRRVWRRIKQVVGENPNAKFNTVMGLVGLLIAVIALWFTFKHA